MNIKSQFDKFGLTLISEIRNKIDSSGAKATGKSSASLREESTDDSFTLYGNRSFKFIEVGRGKGKFPPLNNIYEWLVAKNIQPDGISQKSLAYLIARKISNEGTKLYRENNVRDIYTKAVEDNLKSLFEEVTIESKASISNDLARYFSKN